ncbi:MAG: hypothetical protein ABL958_10855 [Bdellovibrionia bacterium]
MKSKMRDRRYEFGNGQSGTQVVGQLVAIRNAGAGSYCRSGSTNASSRSVSVLGRVILVSFLFATFSNETAFAWAHRGHALIATSAAYVLAKESPMLKEKSFDLEYYSNVPDKIWKDDKSVEMSERPEHYMNLEIYQRELKAQKIPFLKNRDEFFKKFPALADQGGRAYWRVAELSDDLSEIALQLRVSDGSDVAKHQDLQMKWLVHAGILGHYVGDLSMPLHASENKDGEATKQKGIHGYFEADVVDEIFPSLEASLIERVKAQWPTFHSQNAKKDAFDLMVELGYDSLSKKDELLELDKTKGRNLKNASAQYRVLILDRLTRSSLVLAEIWSRHLGWKYSRERFFNFDPKPAYIPVHGAPQAAPAEKK